MPSLDLLLRGGDMIDGTNAPRRRADIGIRAGRVVVLSSGNSYVTDAATSIDVSGLVVAPGFIDAHTHSDALALAAPDAEGLRLAPLLQGVTTEVSGNCGSSLFPSLPERHGELTRFARTLFGTHAELAHDFEEFASSAGVARPTHLLSLAGHGMLRAGVLGFDDRAPSDAELATMCRLLDRALGEGAAGLSSGLIYPPGCYADAAELTALAKVCERHGKPYVTHMRDEMAGVDAALVEALAIAAGSGAALHVSHHKTAGRYGWGRTEHTLASLDAARTRGVDVTCDVYPYVASSTHLHAMLPPWVAQGGVDAMIRRLADPSVRRRITVDIAEGVDGWENTVGNGGWDLISIATAPRHRHLEGERIDALARAAGMDAVEYVCDLLVAEDAGVTVISHSMREDDVRRVLAWPYAMVGSDGVPKGGRPHPRWAGSFARVLGRYVREQRLLSLEEAVHKMSYATAARFGLHGRGVVADGAVADLVAFDPDRVVDRASFTVPLAQPEGVEHVVVAGQMAVRAGADTGVRAGQVLRTR